MKNPYLESKTKNQRSFISRLLLPLSAVVVFAACANVARAQCVSLTTLGSAYTQNFDTLSNTAGSTTNNLTITGWFLTESGGGARDNEQYAVDTGASTTGDMYSYGAAGSTERALGQLRSGTLIPLFGSCYTNNTGSTITSLDVAYNGEQWRLGTAGRTDQMSFEYSTNATDLVTGTWSGVAALKFVTPDTVTTGAKNGNAAGDRTALSTNISGLSIPNGATFWIRWTDTDATGADDGLAVDDFSLTPQGGVSQPTLNISDVTQAEGDAGTTTFTFAVTLTSPAGPGGVTFDIATADGTAQDGNPGGEDNDYVAKSLTGQTIGAASSGPYNFSVTVNGDTIPEPNETFFVNVTNITGANAGDALGQGTINNDDVTLTLIHDIQGSGATSPLVGSSVTIRGIVTGVKSNGFFVQEEDADADANPNTSEGIFVFTSAAPPAAAAFAAQVQVTGTVSEFVPSSDPQQPPLTEIVSPTVSQLSTGNALPTAVVLTTTNPDPAGAFDQLEKYEGMRVSASSITVVGPSDGSVNESAATGTSNGRFHGVVTGVARPFREPGIQAPDVPPTGTIPPIPRWDTNPERLRIESATINSQPILTVKSGDVVGPVVGPLDYGFRGYAIYPDGTLGTPLVTPGTLNTMVTTPTAQEFTVASFNLERFYDTSDDPTKSDVVLTPTAFNNRLLKASIAIRNHLKFPDIVGVQEMENLTTLQALATQINNDAVANAQPNPLYVAYLTEGNDVGGIDVGFLIKTAPVAGGAARVAVNSVTQVGAATTWIDPTDGSTQLLNDRPPLVLDAVVNRGPGASFPVIVINNHLRSLLGIDDNTVSGASTVGDRVRRKRQIQADFLAQYIQGRQTATPGEHLIMIGDMNNLEFNDGYQDSLDTIAGTPPPDNQTVVCAACPSTPNTGDGVDQVNPDLVNLVNTPVVAERYSYVFEGNTQNLDHALVSSGLVTDTTARRIEHPRIDSDYPETARNANTTAFRISDHDPVVAYFTPSSLALADLSVTKSDSPDPVIAGNNITYTITVTNKGPDPATAVAWSDPLPASTTFVSMPSVAGWLCSTPSVGANGTVSCLNPSVAVGSSVFTLTVKVDPSAAGGMLISNTATVSSPTADPDTSNQNGAAITTVADTTSPLITCPGGITKFTDSGQFSATVNPGQPVASDDSGSVTVTGARSDGKPLSATYPIGVTLITWTAKDASNNTASCTQSIVVMVPSSLRRLP